MKRPSLVALVLILAACSGENGLMGERVPNSPPETRVTAVPPSLGQTGYAVSFFWTGADHDGQVVGFEWRISDNGRDGVVDVHDTLEIHLPWRFTAGSDSTFSVSADLDSFSLDVDDPRQDPSTYRSWQTHTFFIRAVDRDGARDPTPAQVSFTATTLTPTIEITEPDFPPYNTCVSGPKVLRFGWEGRDPDNPDSDPTEIRYLFLPWGQALEPCLIEAQYRALAPIRSDDPRWSRWIRYDAPSDSGRIVVLPAQDIGETFLFAVQARDVAGAVTSTFEWNRNVRHIRIGSDNLPLLNIAEPMLGDGRYAGTNGYRSVRAVAGQPFQFDFSCDGSSYGGLIEAYRWGWDVIDLNDPNDPGWALEWGNGPAWRRPRGRSFTDGVHNVVMQCRDNSGTVSRVLYQIEIIPVPERHQQRELLLIDDWPDGPTADERGRDRQWDQRWNDLLDPVLRGFQNTDHVDAELQPELVDFGRMAEYKTVIWFTNAANWSYLYSELAPQSNDGVHFNWLEAYQARVGNLLLVGPGALYAGLGPTGVRMKFPIFFRSSEDDPLGFGTGTRPDGTEYALGTTRWPFTAWCLEGIDMIRPAIGLIANEVPGVMLRHLECDGLLRAAPDEEFFVDYPDAVGPIQELQPTFERRGLSNPFQLSFEEFYNRNTTSRNVTFVPRDCQTPMYRLVPRRAVSGVPAEGIDCRRFGEHSRVEGVPVGVASRAYSQTKQLRGSEDFVWGFHPLAFEHEAVRSALQWIFESRWELTVR